jgi:hypothetical protein
LVGAFPETQDCIDIAPVWLGGLSLLKFPLLSGFQYELWIDCRSVASMPK